MSVKIHNDGDNGVFVRIEGANFAVSSSSLDSPARCSHDEDNDGSYEVAFEAYVERIAALAKAISEGGTFELPGVTARGGALTFNTAEDGDSSHTNIIIDLSREESQRVAEQLTVQVNKWRAGERPDNC